MIKLIHGDCLEKMKDIPDKSIDMILTDLPFGTTACKWDVVIPFNKYVQIGKKVIYEQEYVFDKMKSGVSYKEALEDFLSISKDGLWDNYKRIIKDRGAIVLFGSEPFSSYLRMSNIKQYKYDWVWIKNKAVNFFNVKKMPLKSIENILVFYLLPPLYYPQNVNVVNKEIKNPKGHQIKNRHISGHNGGTVGKTYTRTAENYPRQELSFGVVPRPVHPTQKPVPLLEYLIKTYTLEGETVLDNCAGSGSTGVACINTNRNFIGIEKDAHYFQVGKDRVEKYFEIAKKRIEETKC